MIYPEIKKEIKLNSSASVLRKIHSKRYLAAAVELIGRKLLLGFDRKLGHP